MVIKGTYLSIKDNSGASKVSCIHVYRGSYAMAGDVILVSVKSLRKKRRKFSKVKKGSVVRALVLSTAKEYSTERSFSIKTFINRAIILNKNNKPMGTRVLGPVDKRVRYSRFSRIASLSSGFFK